jgi:hypothetical protein
MDATLHQQLHLLSKYRERLMLFQDFHYPIQEEGLNSVFLRPLNWQQAYSSQIYLFWQVKVILYRGIRHPHFASWSFSQFPEELH